eukprot:12110089-Alexandrium_andersonii.AAC.1
MPCSVVRCADLPCPPCSAAAWRCPAMRALCCTALTCSVLLCAGMPCPALRFAALTCPRASVVDLRAHACSCAPGMNDGV